MKNKIASIFIAAIVFCAILSPAADDGSLAVSAKSERYRVIVELYSLPAVKSGNTIMSLATYNIMSAADSVSKQADVEIENVYTHVFSGFSCEASTEKICELEGMAGVKRVYIARKYELPEPVEFEKIENVKELSRTLELLGESAYDGRGTAIAVLDSGFDTSHTAFALDAGVPVKFTEEDIDAAKGTLGFGEEDLYISPKIPFAYDYAENDTNVFGPISTHGTHVAGIAAGRVVNQTVKGIAPNAQLVLMKVFSDDGAAYDDFVLAALDDAAKLGVDAINLSLGTPCGFSSNDYGTSEYDGYDSVFSLVRQNGVLVSCSAGNSGIMGKKNRFGNNKPFTDNTDYGTIASPATSISSTAVGAAGKYENGTWYIGDFSSMGSTPDLRLKPDVAAPGVRVASSIPDDGDGDNDDYGYMSGTSAAAPHIAGASAVLTQYLKEIYPLMPPGERLQTAEALLMSTADVIKADGVPLSPRAQGSGRFNLYNAIASPVILKYNGGTPKVELGDKLSGGSFNFSFTAKNLGINTVTYNLSADVITDGYEESNGRTFITLSPLMIESSAEFSGGQALTLNPGEEKTVNVTITPDQDAINDLDLVYRYGYYLEGYVYLDGTDNPDLSIPFMGYKGNWNTIPAIDEAIMNGGGLFGETTFYMNYNNKWYEMGANQFIEGSVPEGKYVAVQPGAHIKARLAFLRNTYYVPLEIIDSEGNIVQSIPYITAWCSKAFEISNGVLNLYEVSLFDEEITPAGTASLEDGVYTLRLKGVADREGAELEPSVYNFEFTLDGTAPTLENAYIILDFDSEERYLEAKFRDAHAVMAAEAFTADSESLGWQAAESWEIGETGTFVFDITGRADGFFGVSAMDYARNTMVETVLMEDAFVALYDENNLLLDLYTEKAPVNRENGQMAIKFNNIPPEIKTIKVFRWQGALPFLTSPFEVLTYEN